MQKLMVPLLLLTMVHSWCRGAAPLPSPLAYTSASTNGADLSWVPIPFEKSFRMAYARTRYGTGYYIYQRFVPGTKLSHSIRSWNKTQQPDKKLFNIINRSGNNLL